MLFAQIRSPRTAKHGANEKVAQLLVVPPDVTLASLRSFADTLAAGLAEHDGVLLDLARTQAVDLAFVQLVCAARQKAAEVGKTLQLYQPAPEPLRQVLHRAGFLDRPSAADRAFWLGEEVSE